jgi:hypothetical protein
MVAEALTYCLSGLLNSIIHNLYSTTSQRRTAVAPHLTGPPSRLLHSGPWCNSTQFRNLYLQGKLEPRISYSLETQQEYSHKHVNPD